MNTKIKFRNHFIPQMILKHFTNPDKKIYEFDLTGKEWSSPNGTKSDGGMNTAAVGKENHLYTHLGKDGTLSDRLENKLGELESDSTPIVEKLIAHSKKEWLSDVHLLLSALEYTTLLIFSAIGYLRIPSQIDQARDVAGGIGVLDFQNYLNDEDLKSVPASEIFKNMQLSIATQDLVDMLLSQDSIRGIFEELLEFQWFLINNETQYPLILGDSFVNLLRPGFAKADEVFIPIGRKKVLYGVKPPGLDSKALNREFKSKDKREAFIKRINGISIANSKNFIFSSVKSDSLKRYIIKHTRPTKISFSVGETNSVHTPDCKRDNANVVRMSKD